MEQQITELISNLGFPIFICMALGYYTIKKDKEYGDYRKLQDERIFQTLEKFDESIEKLSALIQEKMK